MLSVVKIPFSPTEKQNRFSGKFHILYICFRRKTHAHSLHTKFYTGLRVPASNRYTGLDTGAIQGFKNQFSGGLFRKMENKRFAGKRGQIDSRIPVGGRLISGRCQRMIRWHNQKNPWDDICGKRCTHWYFLRDSEQRSIDQWKTGNHRRCDWFWGEWKHLLGEKMWSALARLWIIGKLSGKIIWKSQNFWIICGKNIRDMWLKDIVRLWWIWILQNSCILALTEIIQNIPWKEGKTSGSKNGIDSLRSG